jgi:hypothetical protein
MSAGNFLAAWQVTRVTHFNNTASPRYYVSSEKILSPLGHKPEIFLFSAFMTKSRLAGYTAYFMNEIGI